MYIVAVCCYCEDNQITWIKLPTYRKSLTKVESSWPNQMQGANELLFTWLYKWRVNVMEFNATFNNIKVRGSQFYWWRKPEYLEKTTDLPHFIK